MKTYKIGEKEFPVIENISIKDKNGNIIPGMENVPLVDIPQVSDYQWQLDCLNDRIEHPEKYESTENIEEVKARLRKWLSEHEDKKLLI